MNKEIEKQVDAFEGWYQKERKELSKLVDEYRDEYVQSKCEELFDIKVKFIAKQDMFARATTQMKSIFLTATREAKDAEYQQRLDMRKTGKTLEECKTGAWLMTANEHMLALRAEIAHDKARDLKNTAKDFKDEIIQRISVVKGEEFNARQNQ